MSTYTQNGPFKVVSPLGGDTLLFSSMAGEEAISVPFSFTVDLLSENKSIEANQMLRKPLVIELTVDGSTRYIHGLVRRFTELDVAYGTLYAYRAEIVPWLWFLSLASDCRVYENMTAVDIIEDVFKRNSWHDYTVQVNGTPSKREYCVQYRETDLAFVSRLMEEEGLFYFFQHSDSKHTMVIADNNSAFQAIPGQKKVTAQEKASGGTSFENFVGNLRFDRQVPAGTVTLYDYNYLDGQVPIKSTVSSTGPEEVYDYPGGFTDQGGGDAASRLQLDAAETLEAQLSGAGTCRGFTPGYQFTLSDYFRDDLNGDWNITRVRHTARVTGYFGSGAAESGANYVNDFTAIANTVVYKPIARTPRPLVYGTQTAMVVGPSGSEINVDKYGRVQVKFFWEREDKGDPAVSCWVRVATLWAGKQRGALFIPRVGDEVVVAFEEGNPDRPIIVGSVWNPDNPPIYDLPANKTQSGIKTRSSEKGGAADFNEFRFEDKKGSEQILLHAQKNFDTEVENDRTTYVGHAETKTIDKGDYTEHLKEGNYSLTIDKGNQVTQLKEGNYHVNVDQGVHNTQVSQGDVILNVPMGNVDYSFDQGNYKIDMHMGNMEAKLGMGDYKVETNLGAVSIKSGVSSITIEAMTGITLKCGSSKITIDMMGVTIDAMQVKVNGTIQTQISSSLMTQVSASAMTQISGSITMIG